MTERLCPVRLRGDDVCGRPLPPGAEACSGCLTNARLDLRALVTGDDGAPGLLAELDVAITRQTRMTSTGGASGCPDGCTHGPLDDDRCVAGARAPFDVRASEARLALVTLLHGWARVWDEEHPMPDLIAGAPCWEASWPRFGICAHYSCVEIVDVRNAHYARRQRLAEPASQADLLRSKVERCAGRPWIPDLASEVGAAVREAWAAIDRPPDQRVIGRCPTCGYAVYAPQDAPTATCRGCETRWDTKGLRDASLAASDRLLTKAEIATLLGMPRGTLDRWSSERRITSDRCNPAGQPLYALGPIAAHVTAGTAPPIPREDRTA